MTVLEQNQSLKKTPLFDQHLAMNGKMVDFGGWNLPIQYSSILSEHQWTRSSCSFFDVSHLGEIRVSGLGAHDYLQKRLPIDVSRCAPGTILYTVLCDEKGYALDDILVYGAPNQMYYLIVNAANIEKDMRALVMYKTGHVEITNMSDTMACIAIQGPKTEEVLEALFGFSLKSMPYYTHKEDVWNQKRVWISRTGYTGEDGFEIFSANEDIAAVWEKLCREGRKLGAMPAGLGARNTLRLEAGNVLYGHELDEKTTPLEAGLGFTLDFNKSDFVGREALFLQKQNGVLKKIAAFKMLDRSIPRDGYLLMKDGQRIGSVTSGSFAPTVGAGIGLAFFKSGFEKLGSKFEVELHGRLAPAEVVKRPFIDLRHKKNNRGA